MKHIIIFIYSFVSLSCVSNNIANSENYNEDSLKKYSYLLTILQKSTTGSSQLIIAGLGSGFFVRNNNKIFLISANHVFTGNDPMHNTKHDLYGDILGFDYIKKDGQRGSKYIYLDSIKKANPPFYFNESPDLIAFEITGIPYNENIYSIEKFILPTNDKDYLEDSICVWGYPFVPTEEFYALDAPVFNISKYKGKIFKGELKDNPYRKIDSLNNIITPKSITGISGSPVFLKKIKTENGTKKETFQFYGIIIGSEQSNNVSFVVKKEELAKMLSKK